MTSVFSSILFTEAHETVGIAIQKNTGSQPVDDFF
jgi:hypothetical protein